jgi:hypothetical protein
MRPTPTHILLGPDVAQSVFFYYFYSFFLNSWAVNTWRLYPCLRTTTMLCGSLWRTIPHLHWQQRIPLKPWCILVTWLRTLIIAMQLQFELRPTTILAVMHVTCRRDRVLAVARLVTVQLVRVTVTMTHRRLWDSSLPMLCVTGRESLQSTVNGHSSRYTMEPWHGLLVFFLRKSYCCNMLYCNMLYLIMLYLRVVLQHALLQQCCNILYCDSAATCLLQHAFLSAPTYFTSTCSTSTCFARVVSACLHLWQRVGRELVAPLCRGLVAPLASAPPACESLY